MSGGLRWVVVIAGGVLLVLVVSALIGARDHRGETVPAATWAQSTCGAVGVWRGEIEAIVEDIRTPSSTSTEGGEERQSETPQGRTGFVRKGLERAVLATETLVEGIDNAGTPDTGSGQQAAQLVSGWANDALDDLEGAEDSLDEEADSLEEAIEQLANATTAIGAALASGVATIVEVRELDPELAAALDASSTCQQLREETS
jgi:hypothetical protein